MPAQSSDATAPGTPFASLLGQADSTGVDDPVAGTETGLNAPAPASPVASTSVLYPATYYMTQTGTAPMQSQILEAGTDIQAQDVSKTEDSGNEEAALTDGSMVLAYEFIAGQWIQQPATPPLPVKQGTGETAGRQLDAGLSAPAKTHSQSEPVVQNALGSIPAPAKTGDAIAPQSITQPSERGRASAKVSDFQNAVPSAAVSQNKTAGLPEQPQKLAASTSVEQIATASSKADASLVSLPTPKSETAESAAQFSQEKITLSSSTETSANGGGTQNSNQQFAQGRPALLPLQEKFAAPGVSDRAETASGVNTSTDTKEKKSLFVNGKEVTSGSKKVGTGTANREIAMSYFATNKSPSVDLSTIAADGIQQKTTSEIKADTQLSAQAPRLVQEIRTIADRISSIERNSVEVRFDFNDTERLSVRVEYRDGTVHTTFKTDSSQLRDVVAHEWQAQNASADQRSYRMADPVFSQTTLDRQNFAGGDSSGRQRAFEQQAQSGTPSFASAFGRSAGTTTSVVSPAARSARPETSLHLHALA